MAGTSPRPTEPGLSGVDAYTSLKRSRARTSDPVVSQQGDRGMSVVFPLPIGLSKACSSLSEPGMARASLVRGNPGKKRRRQGLLEPFAERNGAHKACLRHF